MGHLIYAVIAFAAGVFEEKKFGVTDRNLEFTKVGSIF